MSLVNLILNPGDCCRSLVQTEYLTDENNVVLTTESLRFPARYIGNSLCIYLNKKGETEISRAFPPTGNEYLFPLPTNEEVRLAAKVAHDLEWRAKLDNLLNRH